MPFALANIKVYPVKAHSPLASQCLQVATFTLTAANTDTAANLRTIAEASVVDGAASLAECLRECSAVISVHSDVSARTTTAAGASYALSTATSTEPTLTFAGAAATPVTQVISLVLQPRTDSSPVIFGV